MPHKKSSWYTHGNAARYTTTDPPITAAMNAVVASASVRRTGAGPRSRCRARHVSRGETPQSRSRRAASMAPSAGRRTCRSTPGSASAGTKQTARSTCNDARGLRTLRSRELPWGRPSSRGTAPEPGGRRRPTTTRRELLAGSPRAADRVDRSRARRGTARTRWRGLTATRPCTDAGSPGAPAQPRARLAWRCRPGRD